MNDTLEKALLRETVLRVRIQELETALADAISTYRDDGKTILVTAERQEAWAAALKGTL